MCGTDVNTYIRERPGMSAFAREDGVVYHTYSTYARGLDGLWGMYQWLDRTPKGRNETSVWWRRTRGFATACEAVVDSKSEQAVQTLSKSYSVIKASKNGILKKRDLADVKDSVASAHRFEHAGPDHNGGGGASTGRGSKSSGSGKGGSNADKSGDR
jgi:hypothetical protein